MIQKSSLLKITDWFSENRLCNIGVVILYFLLVVLPHEEIGQFLASTLDEPLGRTKYNQLVLSLGILGGIGYLVLIGLGVRNYPKRLKTVLIYLTATFLSIFVAIKFLMVVNIEMIHLVQYGILTLLLFPLFSSFKTTLFFAIILGCLDEAYQYWILTPLSTDYYDFNDLIINQLGASLGLVLLYANGLQVKPKILEWYQSAVNITLFLLSLILLLFYFNGVLSIYPINEQIQPPLLLIRNVQPDFWTVAEPDIKFHVLRPIWGTLIGILLFLFYKKMEILNEY